ncbi:processed acidic surface protein [Fredinandcohnia sp. QZ13]|uniref:processed acidic surface protein n=1 Tax=Fredinandcohnia sp. QZ13 TaxID=3073144 RepID=UPI00285373E8|nr:processed acidic surface protein [Fredinandcohnia sp. QZ13]MDR4889351.1 processed acidic surface protein [Fredinandcohnia sp. QZ13]
MKKFLLVGVLFLFQLAYLSVDVFAEVTTEDLKKYTTETGLTEDDLEDYLAVYDLSLKDFENVNELVSYLGEPVNNETIQTLLTKHNLNEDELQHILGGFGESVEDYLFIKDLDTTVDFYLNHAEVLVEAERMLSEVGLTEDEIDGLFLHFLSLNDINLEEKMKSISSNLEQYFSYNNSEGLSSEQQKELLVMYDNMIEVFELQPRYYLLKDGAKEAIAYNKLLEMDTLDGAELLVELYRANDEYLLDLKLSEEMLATDFIIERGEKLLTVATLATEMSMKVQGNKLPITASPYSNLLLIGTLFLLLGIGAVFMTRKYA